MELQDKIMVCLRCDGRGFIYDPDHKGLKLCSCVEDACKCKGENSYQYFEVFANPETQEQDFRLVRCGCAEYRRNLNKINYLMRSAEIPSKYRWKFIDDFQIVDKQDKLIPGADQIRGYLISLLETLQTGESWRGFFLWGIPGNGKTLLNCIALNELILRTGKPGKFLDMSFKYFQKLRSTYSEGSSLYGQTLQIIEELSSVQFLIVDDFGVQRNTEWEVEMLYNLIDTRYEEELPTFFTTNKDIEDIKRLGDGRFYSRFLEMCVIIQVKLPDFRQNFKLLA